MQREIEQELVKAVTKMVGTIVAMSLLKTIMGGLEKGNIEDRARKHSDTTYEDCNKVAKDIVRLIVSTVEAGKFCETSELKE